MSDGISAHPGLLSPRNIDTLFYLVTKELPNGIISVGTYFSAWPQGETFANVSGLGLGPVKNSDIERWEEEGRITLLDGPEGKPRKRLTWEKSSLAIPVAENVPSPTGGPSHPWTLPGAENAKVK